MAQYRAKGPDGRTYKFDAPAGLTDEAASFFLNQYLRFDQAPPAFEPTPAPAPTPETGLVPSIKRGFKQLGVLGGDILPAMGARLVGADEYAERQLREAAESQREIQERFPAAVPSYTNIKNVGDAVTYITEAVGEAIPSILPSLFTGGAAALLSRPATAAAMQAARDVATAEATRAAASGALTAASIEGIKKTALDQGLQAARRTALKYQAAGAITGSAAMNVPEVYQNILEETGKEDLGAALVSGGFNAVLDAILPLQLLRKAKIAGIPENEIIGAWYKRGAVGLGKGFLTEGATEAVQEMSSAAAEAFVGQHPEFFTPKNLVRFIDAGLKGGIGGGVITGASDIAFGRAPEAAPRPITLDQRSVLGSLQGDEDAAESDRLAGGEGAGMAGVAGAKQPSGRPVGAKPSGVVSTAEDAGQPPTGARVQPPSVTPSQVDTFLEQYNDLRNELSEVYRRGAGPTELNRAQLIARDIASIVDDNASWIGDRTLIQQLKTPTFDGTKALQSLVQTRLSQGVIGTAPTVVAPTTAAGVPTITPGALDQIQVTPPGQARGMAGDLFGGRKDVLDLTNRALAAGRGDPESSVRYLQDQLQRTENRISPQVNNGIWGRSNAALVGMTPQDGFNNPATVVELTLAKERQATEEAIAAIRGRGQARGMAGDLFSGEKPERDVGTEQPESLTDVFGAPERAPKKRVKQVAPAQTAAGAPLTAKQQVDIFATKKADLENQLAAARQEAERLKNLSENYPTTKVRVEKADGTVTYDLGSAIRETASSIEKLERDLAGANRQLSEAQRRLDVELSTGKQPTSLPDELQEAAAELEQETTRREPPTPFTSDFDLEQRSERRRQAREAQETQQELDEFGVDEDIAEEGTAKFQKERVVAPLVDTERVLETEEGQAIKSFFDAIQPATGTESEAAKHESVSKVAQEALLEYDIAEPGETTTAGGLTALRYLANRVGGMDAFRQLVEQLRGADPARQAFLLQRAGLPNLTTRRGIEEFGKQIQEYFKQLPAKGEGIPTPQRSTPSRITKTPVPYKEDITQAVGVAQEFKTPTGAKPRRPSIATKLKEYTISDTRLRAAIRILRGMVESGGKLSDAARAAANYLNNRTRETFGQALQDLAFDLAMYEVDPRNYGSGSTFYGEGGKYAQDFRDWIAQNLDANTLALLDELVADVKATAEANQKFDAAVSAHRKALDAYMETEQAKSKISLPRAPKKSKDRVGVETPTEEQEKVAEPKVSKKNLPRKQGLYEVHPAIKRAIESGDVRQVLGIIAAAKNNPYYAALADRLLESGITAKIKLVSRDTIEPLNDTAPIRETFTNYIDSLRELVTTTLPQERHAELLRLLNSNKLRDLERALDELNTVSQGQNSALTDAQIQLVGSATDFINQHYGWIGKYDPTSDTIFMRQEVGMTNHVLLHEALHAATVGVLDRPETLSGVRRQGYDQLVELYKHAKGLLENSELNKSSIYGLTDLHEFVSEALTNPEFQAMLRTIRYKASPFSMMNWFTESIRKLFNIKKGYESNVLNETIFAADAMLLGGTAGKDTLTGPMTEAQLKSQAKGMAKPTKKRIPVGRPNSTTSLRNYMTPRPWNEVKNDWSTFYRGLKSNLRPYALGALTLRQIADLVNGRIPQLDNFIRVVEDYMSRTNRILQESGDITKRWQRLQAQDPEMSRKIGAVMHRATIQRIDPDKATPEQRNTDPDLMTMWRELTPEAKQIYRDVRDFYERRFSEYKRTLRSRIVQMRNLGVSETTINEIRNEFEKGIGAGPYFPLMRYGRFWYQIGKGNSREYYMFETANEREAHLAERLARDSHLTDTLQYGDDYMKGMDFHARESNFLKSAFDAVEQIKAVTPGQEDALKQSIKDELYQAWLTNLPETSFRNRFVHRTGVEGFSQDALRNFSSSSFHMAYQQARFEYSPEMFSQMTAARMQLKDRVDVTDRANVEVMRENSELTDYVRELDRRLSYILNPEDTGMVVSTLSNIGFIWYLTSFASAATNILGGLTIGLPTLIGQQVRLNPGMSYTTATLKSLGQMKDVAAQILGTGFGLERGPRIRDNMVLFPSLDRAGLSRLDQAAYNRFVADGLIDITATYDQSGLAASPTESYDGIRNRVMTALAALFHNAERFNREVIAMSAFRAGMEKRANYPDKQRAFAESIAEAKDVTTRSMFDYSTANKPRYMQHPAARVILQFKQFPQQMTFFLARNFVNMIKGASPEVRREATARFVGTMGMTGILAGTTGLWGFSAAAGVINAVVNAFGEEGEEPFDFELEYMNWAVNTFGTNLGMFLTRGAGNAAGVDLHSRVSLDNMWFRDGRKNLDEEEAWRQFLVDLMGPTVGLTVNVARAVDLYNQGHADRALETVAPAFIKQPLIAARFAEEGVKTMRGDKLVEDVGPFDLFMQSLGFRPAEIAEIQYYNIQKKGQEQKVLKKRQQLLDLFGLSFMANDAEAGAKARDKIIEFNSQHPSVAIAADSLSRSIKQRLQKATQAQHGLILDKRMMYLLNDDYVKQLEDNEEE